MLSYFCSFSPRTTAMDGFESRSKNVLQQHVTCLAEGVHLDEGVEHGADRSPSDLIRSIVATVVDSASILYALGHVRSG